MKHYDIIIIGAGAAGLMCAIEASKSGKSVAILDKSDKPAEKIRISGGGRCNFTNIHTSPADYISNNKHFCKSALKQFTQHDFIEIIEQNMIKYHEKTLGQLFCDDKAQDIIDILLGMIRSNGVNLILGCDIDEIKQDLDAKFQIVSNFSDLSCDKLVIATGGPSIPKMGATDFAYKIAKQFNLKLIEPKPALVPLTFDGDLLQLTKELSGISLDAIVSCGKKSFREGLLFTHRGLSGPSILQISSYWNHGDTISINLCPNIDMLAQLKQDRDQRPKQLISNILSDYLPKRLCGCILGDFNIKIAEVSGKKLIGIADHVNNWVITPKGTEGYRTAEVTKGGIDTKELSSKTFESNKVVNLYFIGEAIDVTGHLGGFNFQWAWSSGYACGNHLSNS